jgi:hypothetical protein
MLKNEKSEIEDSLKHSVKEVSWYLSVIIPDTIGMLALLVAVAAIKYFGALFGVKSDFIDGVHSTAVGISAISLMALLALKVSARIYVETVKIRGDARRAKSAAQRDSLSADEVAYESVLLRESSVLRFQGLRMNKALALPEWINGIEKLDELRLLFLAPYSNPTSTEETEHNRRVMESIDKLRRIKKDCGRLIIRVWFTQEFPKNNLMIFDDRWVLMREYDKVSMQRSSVTTVLSDRRGSGEQLRKMLRSFDETCELSQEQVLHTA